MLTGSWPREDLTISNSWSMLEPYTSGSIGAAKNGNSGLAGLEINLGACKGRRSCHRTLYLIYICSDPLANPPVHDLTDRFAIFHPIHKPDKRFANYSVYVNSTI